MNPIVSFLTLITRLARLGLSKLVKYSLIALAALKLRKWLLLSAVTGPYSSAIDNPLLRALQRTLINCTRQNLKFSWFPTNFINNFKPKRINDNGHAKSGAIRDEARRSVTAAIDAVGAHRFEISPGGHSPDEDGVHQHYSPGDLHRGITNGSIKHNSVVVGIDIDYYLRDPHEYLGLAVSSVFHTFAPTKVCGVDGDAPFRIIDNHVVYDVGGGGRWQHRVWDWCAPGEYLECNPPGLFHKILRFIGLTKVVYQKVHHARPWIDAPHRAMVWTIPQYSCWRFTYLGCDIGARNLKRINFTDKGRPDWNIISSFSDAGLLVSLGRQGEDVEITIPKPDFDVLMGLQSAQAVSSRMINMKYTDPKVVAMMLQYYRNASRTNTDPERIMRPAAVQVHWPKHSDADAPEVSARSYSNPLVSDPSCMPMPKRFESLSLSLDRRVEFVKNLTRPSKKYAQYASEFIRLVCPVPGIVVPYDIVDVIEMLTKPSQVLAIKQVAETIEMQPQAMIEAFIKNEPCQKPARIISSWADARFLAQYSRYTLAVRDIVLHADHNDHWFMPGNRPVEIARRVQEYVGFTGDTIETDFSNLDGTVSEWMQVNIGQALYNRAVDPNYVTELMELQNFELYSPARAKRFGFRYDPGPGVKSGSPTTCDKNTVYACFVQYVAIRRLMTLLTPEEAFRLLGLVFGDDGLFDATFAQSFSKVAKDLGLSVKVDKNDLRRGVCFLGRVYPDPINTMTSFQDPLRTLRKLHLTTRDPNIPLATAAVDRLSGYLVTDSMTPLIRDYCTKVVSFYQKEADEDLHRFSRRSVDTEKPYWWHSDGAWPQFREDYDLMLTVLSYRLGFDRNQILDFITKIHNASSPWSLPSLDRSDYESPYVDTFTADGGWEGEEVDERAVQKDRDVAYSRLNQGLSGEDKPGSSAGAGQSNTPRHNGGGGVKGSGQLPRPSSKDKEDRSVSGGGIVGQANIPRSTGGASPAVEDVRTVGMSINFSRQSHNTRARSEGSTVAGGPSQTGPAASDKRGKRGPRKPNPGRSGGSNSGPSRGRKVPTSTDAGGGKASQPAKKLSV